MTNHVMPKKSIQLQSLLDVHEVKRHFLVRQGWLSDGKKVLKAVDGVNLQVNEGETVAIVGESGCGKSTLARMIVGLDAPTSGQIYIRGDLVSGKKRKNSLMLRKNLQMIFQDPYSSLNPRMSVGQLLREPLMLHRMGNSKWRKKRSGELLELVGLSPKQLNKYPHEFSGGQRQRIGIARALSVEPNLIICDEPVSALDVSVQAQIINLLLELKKTLNLSLVFISHDLSVVQYLADRVAVMYLGRIVEMANKHDIFQHPRHPYTQMLLSSIPKSHPKLPTKNILSKGELPSPFNVPSGCRYRSRCPYADKLCETNDPELMGDQHLTACHHWKNILKKAPKDNSHSSLNTKNQYIESLSKAFTDI